MRRLVAIFYLATPISILAHEGHGDTAVHALAHFAESGVSWLWFAFAVIALILVLRQAFKQWSRRK